MLSFLLGHISCPECRVQHYIPRKGFASHFLLERLIEKQAMQGADQEHKSTMECESGLDSNAAMGWCVDCHSYLCQQCVDLHKRQKITRAHKMLSLTEVKEGALTQVHQKHMCLEHEDEELKIYCKTCQDIICGDCAIISHKGHKCTFIKDAEKEIVQELQELVSQVKKKEEDFQGYIVEVNTVMAAKTENFAECEKKVNEYFDDYIQRHRQMLLDKLHQAKTSDENTLAESKKDLEFAQTRLASSVTFTEQLLSMGSLTEIALLSKQTSQHLRSLVRMRKQHEVDKSLWKLQQKGEPLSCGIQASSLVFDTLPKEVLYGVNEVSIRSFARPDVSIITDSGKECRVTSIASTGPASWHVTYIIPVPPLTKSVRIAAQTFGKTVSATIPCSGAMAVGTRVSRGPDWDDGDQDGGPGSVGVVTSCNPALPFGYALNVKWNEKDPQVYFFSELNFPIKTEI